MPLVRTSHAARHNASKAKIVDDRDREDAIECGAPSEGESGTREGLALTRRVYAIEGARSRGAFDGRARGWRDVAAASAASAVRSARSSVVRCAGPCRERGVG